MRGQTLFVCAVLLLIISLSPVAVALAHAGQPIAPHDLWTAWNTDIRLLLTLEATVLVYLWGVQKAWRRAGVGRGISVRRGAAFVGANMGLTVALVSPLDALSGALFSAHMLQHTVLVFVAAPLLVLSDFLLVTLWALPRRWAQAVGHGWNRAAALRRVWRALKSPPATWLLFAVTLWIWHAPALYEAALQNDTFHAFEHLGFLVTAMLFWWVLLDTSRPNYVRYGIAIPYLFTTALHTGILGALMTFASQPWYAFYAASVAPWGLSPLQDQQLAGLIMWLPGGAVLTLLAVLYFGAWLGAIEQRVEQL